MFTLAHYVFGAGKEDTKDLQQSTNSFYNPNYDIDHCLQTTIENDWILIEIEKSPVVEPKTATKIKKPTKLKINELTRKEKLKSSEESWFVDPPECFKNTSQNAKLDVKTSSLENLLIEHPSMSVFDDLFVKKKPAQKVDLVNGKKLSTKSVANKVENGKENAIATHPVKKKPSEHGNHVNLLAPSNNNALTAAIEKEKVNKKSFTKKNYERKNKVAFQRNGPIIRHKKMFTHFNGIYHNRNHS